MAKETAPGPDPEPEPSPEPEPAPGDDQEAKALWARLAPHHEASTRKVLDEFFGEFATTEEQSGKTDDSGGTGGTPGSGGAGATGTSGGRGTGSGPAKAAAKASAGEGQVLNDLGAFFFGRREPAAKK